MYECVKHEMQISKLSVQVHYGFDACVFQHTHKSCTHTRKVCGDNYYFSILYPCVVKQKQGNLWFMKTSRLFSTTLMTIMFKSYQCIIRFVVQ